MMAWLLAAVGWFAFLVMAIAYGEMLKRYKLLAEWFYMQEKKKNRLA